MTKNKLLAFDVDGVLVESRTVHFLSFRDALKEVLDFDYTKKMDLEIRDLSTPQKVEVLIKKFGLGGITEEDLSRLKKLKFEYMWRYDNKFIYNYELAKAIKYLSREYQIAMVSNARLSYVKMVADKLNILDHVSIFLGNDLGIKPKPSPDLYLNAMRIANVNPNDTFIFEDSETGITAAVESGANVIKVKSMLDLDIPNVTGILILLQLD